MAELSVIAREWINLEQATAQLGKSPKTIERLVSAGHLRSRLEPREGRKPERLYHSGDLERIKAEAIPAPAAEPKRAIVPAKTQELTISPHTVTTLNDVMTRWLNRDQAVGVREKLWLNLDEAHAYSGRSKRWLLVMCREGKLTAQKDGGWKIRRASLEAFAG